MSDALFEVRQTDKVQTDKEQNILLAYNLISFGFFFRPLNPLLGILIKLRVYDQILGD